MNGDDLAMGLAGFLTSIQALLELPGKFEILAAQVKALGNNQRPSINDAALSHSASVQKNDCPTCAVLKERVDTLRQRLIEKRAVEASETDGICDNCIRLTQAVDSTLIDTMLGMFREMMIEARDCIKSGVDLGMAERMINKIIELASQPLSPIKERSKAFLETDEIDPNQVESEPPFIAQPESEPQPIPKNGKGRKPNWVDWDGLASTHGHGNSKALLRAFRKEGLQVPDIAARLGIKAQAVYYRMNKDGVH